MKTLPMHSSSAALRILFVAALSTMALAAPAQEKLRIMGPSAPQASYAALARVMQQTMPAAGIAPNVEVYYVPGDGGLVGLRQFVRETRGDGSQLMITGYTTIGSVLINKSSITLNDVTPIARLTADIPFAFLVPAASPIKNAQQLAAMLRADPAKVAWVAGSVGGAGYMAVAMFAQLNQVDPARLNFNVSFGDDTIEAVVSGKATVGLSSAYKSYEKELKAGRVRLIGISAAQRRPGIDCPTLTEQGIGLVFENWRGVVAAPGITAEQKQVLAAAVERMAGSPAWKEILKQNDWVDAYLGGPEFETFLKAELPRVEQAFRAAGMIK